MKHFIIACLASFSYFCGLAQQLPNFKVAATSFKKDTTNI